MSFFTTTEFYVIMAVVAATIVIIASRPDTRGEAREHLLAGILVDDDTQGHLPALHIACLDDGKVALTRLGLPDMTADDAVSLAIKVIGQDIKIEERLTWSKSRKGAPVSQALFTLDFLPSGYYHIRYNSESTGRFTAFTLHVRPGITTTRPLNE